MLSIVAGHRRSRPEPPPKCPHCHRELEGWEPPSTLSGYQIAWRLSLLVLGAAAVLAVLYFILSIFTDWAFTGPLNDDGTPRAPETLVHVAVEHWRFVVGLARRIW